jgi:hypothetical protein
LPTTLEDTKKKVLPIDEVGVVEETKKKLEPSSPAKHSVYFAGDKGTNH